MRTWKRQLEASEVSVDFEMLILRGTQCCLEVPSSNTNRTWGIKIWGTVFSGLNLVQLKLAVLVWRSPSNYKAQQVAGSAKAETAKDRQKVIWQILTS